MTRLKKENQYIHIKALIFLFICKQGYFDYWLDGDILFSNVAKSMNCSIHLVKKVFFKDVYIYHKDFIEKFEY